jgi:DNA-binding winged helix-turn-helix (wHTH) protein
MGEVASKLDIAGPPAVHPRDAGKHVTVGPFIVDLSSMELRRGGRKVCVQEKPVQLLSILLERPGKLFSRAELRQRLWPANTFVDFEHSINTAVKKLRGALGDHAAQPEFIETVLHHGYRLIAPVSGLQSRRKRPRLVILPFENLDRADGCFSRALWEALITQLGKKCTMLDVIAPLTIQHDRVAVERWPESYSEYLLSGSLWRSKEQVRITVRLVRSEDLCCLWCDSYTRMHPENLLVQDEVSAGIAQGVFELFSPNESKPLAG